MTSSHITSWQTEGGSVEVVTDFIFLSSKIAVGGDCSHEIKRNLLLRSKVIRNIGSIWKSRDITLLTKLHIVKVMAFPVVLYCCEIWTMKKTEGWRTDAFKLWCWRDSWKSLGLQVNQPLNPKGNQPWIFIGRMVAEAEAPIFWPPDGKSWLTGKDPDAGKDWGQEEKGMTEYEMAGGHHWLNGHEFEETSGDSEGQGSLLVCSPWGHKESDTT